MSLGLYLKGQFSPDKVSGAVQAFDRAVLEELETWLSNVAFEELEWSQWTEDAEGNPCLMVSLHPGAEPILLTHTVDGALIISASTSSAGPGYHIFCCDLMRTMAQVHDIEWSSVEESEVIDETGYFDSGDKIKLYNEFENWISSLTSRVKELSKEGAKFHLAMPFDGHQFSVPEPILTQLGPRSYEWLETVAEEPISGRDIFPWWEEGHGAEYHLGRALCYMWNSVRWREPLTEKEAELLERIMDHLDSAYSLDPDLNYPWQEWAEVIEFLGCEYEWEEQIDKRARSAARAELVGYRRQDVRKNLGGGWSVAVPGNFVEELEEGQTFLAFDETRNVRVTCMSASDSNGNSLEAGDILRKIKVIDDPLQYEFGPVQGRAFFEHAVDDESAFWMLRGVSAAQGTFAQITICFESESEQSWAIDTWKSLDHRSTQKRGPA